MVFTLNLISIIKKIKIFEYLFYIRSIEINFSINHFKKCYNNKIKIKLSNVLVCQKIQYMKFYVS